MPRVFELKGPKSVELLLEFKVPRFSPSEISLFVALQLPDGSREMRVFSEPVAALEAQVELFDAGLKLDDSSVETRLPAQERFP